MLYRTHRSSIILYISIIFSIITKEGHISGIVITQEEEDYEVVRTHVEHAVSVWYPYKKETLKRLKKFRRGQLN